PEHNTDLRELPMAIRTFHLMRRGSQGLGASSLNRPAPPWPRGFSSSGRIVFNSPASVHGGLTIRSPVEARGPPDACGATENSSRRHFPAGLLAAAAPATSRARVSVARRLLTGYQIR